jgi:hypothetical protein
MAKLYVAYGSGYSFDTNDYKEAKSVVARNGGGAVYVREDVLMDRLTEIKKIPRDSEFRWTMQRWVLAE